MPQSAAFEEIKRYPIESLNLEYQEYEHQKTGARDIDWQRTMSKMHFWLLF